MQETNPGAPIQQAPEKQNASTSSDSASINQQYFDAQGSGEFVDGSPHLKHSELRRLCQSLLNQAYLQAGGSKKEISVLDMGAGDGVLSLALLQKGARVTAV